MEVTLTYMGEIAGTIFTTKYDHKDASYVLGIWEHIFSQTWFLISFSIMRFVLIIRRHILS